MPEAKKNRLRRGEALPEEAAFVVRGDLLDPAVLSQSAQENHTIYGFFGVSSVRRGRWNHVGRDRCDQAATGRMGRAVTARALLASGLELWDTGQAPHYDVVHDDVDQLVGRILECEHRVVRNPAHSTGDHP
jgi:hypothetical protein